MFSFENGITVPETSPDTLSKQQACYDLLMSTSRITLATMKNNPQIVDHYAMYWHGIKDIVNDCALENESDLFEFIMVFFPDAEGNWPEDIMHALIYSEALSSYDCIRCCDKVVDELLGWLNSGTLGTHLK